MEQKMSSITTILQKQSISEISLIQQKFLNQTIKEEINLEKQTSNKISKQLSEQLGEVQQQAVQIARRLELESKKYQQLTQLVQDSESRIYEQKKKNSDLIRAKQENEDDILPGLLKKQRKLEYDLEQTIIKHNQALCQINQTIEVVNAARSERVVYSGVFKNIERQMFDSELQYKKLLIEKILCEKKLENEKKEFQKILLDQNKKEQEAPVAAQQCPFNQNKNSDTLEKKLRTFTNVLSFQKDDKPSVQPLQKNQAIYKQNVVKSIFLETGCSNVKEITDNLENFEAENEGLYKELLNIDQAISTLQRKRQHFKRIKKQYDVVNQGSNSKNLAVTALKANKKKLDQEISNLTLLLDNYTHSFERIEQDFQMKPKETEPDLLAIELTQRAELLFEQILPKQNIVRPDRKIQMNALKLPQRLQRSEPMKLLSQNEFIQICKQELKSKKPTKYKQTQ